MSNRAGRLPVSCTKKCVAFNVSVSFFLSAWVTLEVTKTDGEF